MKVRHSDTKCMLALGLKEEMFTNRVEVKVKIPEELKPWLVDDWDLITRQKQVIKLNITLNLHQLWWLVHIHFILDQLNSRNNNKCFMLCWNEAGIKSLEEVDI